MKKGLDRYTEMVWRPFFEDLFSFVSGKRVLDVGCGDARYTSQLMIDNVYKGLDIKETIYTTDIGSAEDMPYQDGMFDEVVAIGVLDYTDPMRSISEMNRVLKMGGTLDILVPNKHNPYHMVSSVFGKKGKRRYGRHELVDYLENGGFVVKNVVVMGYAFYVPGKWLQELCIPLWTLLDRYIGDIGGMNIFIEACKEDEIW